MKTLTRSMTLALPCLAMAAATNLAANARADALILAANPALANQIADNEPGSLGYQFTVPVGAEYLVTALGYYDIKTDGTVGSGLSEAHGVALYSENPTSKLVANVVILPGNLATLDNGFRYEPATYTLTAGTYDLVEGIRAGSGDAWLYLPQPIENGLFTNGGSNPFQGIFQGTPNIIPLDSGAGGSIYVGPNLQYTSVVPTPEPASLGLIALGGLALIRRRRA